ncbi:MAG: hypothetical protein ACRDMH_18100 [Solirubrobacterales bacterium]
MSGEEFVNGPDVAVSGEEEQEIGRHRAPHASAWCLSKRTLEPSPGLAEGAYLQTQFVDDSYLQVILTKDRGALYVEVADHDGKDHKNDAIAVAQAVLAQLHRRRRGSLGPNRKPGGGRQIQQRCLAKPAQSGT